MSTVYQAVAPSNIALIKYWGKRDDAQQIPAGPSLSMTLAIARTITNAELNNRDQHTVAIKGHELFASDPFARKIFSHLNFLQKEIGAKTGLKINTENTFPSSCGLASSASGFAALTLASLCCWLETASFADLEAKGFDVQRIAALSRMGSGSSCRSLQGGFVNWSVTPENVAPVSQKLSVLAPATHWPLSDIMVLINQERKQTSSSEGHKLASTSPLFKVRLASMQHKIQSLTRAILEKDIDRFGEIIEAEALDMHAVMLSSQPPLKYLGDDTIEFLSWMKAFRQKHSDWKAYFTIDAGPNVHVICERADAPKIAQTIGAHFPKYELLLDEVGTGAKIRALEKS